MKELEFETLLHQALCPQITPSETVVHNLRIRKGNHMNIKLFVKRACTAAAVILLLATTAYAADTMNIATLITGSFSRTCKTIEDAEKIAGFEIDGEDAFSNGYTLESARVNETKGLDKDDRVRLSYPEISMTLRNAAGEKLTLTAYEAHESIPSTDLPPDQIRSFGEIRVSYRVDHYKFVPENYTQTEADKIWLQTPGNFMSYGSKTVEETNVAFLTWEKDGICYILLNQGADEPVDSLYSMAEEMICK